MIDHLLSAPRRLQQFADAVLRTIRTVSWNALILSGLAISIASTASSFLIPTKVIAVIVAAIGSSVGTAIVTLVIPKLTGLRLEQARDALKAETSKHIADEAELTRLRKMKIKYAQAVERLSAMRRIRIDPASITPLQELVLGSIPLHMTHVVRKTLGESEKAGVTEYLGAFQLSTVTKWGIDLKQIRIRELADGKLEISGLGLVNLGSKDEQTSVLLSEVRDRSVKLVGVPGFRKEVDVIDVRSSSGCIDGVGWAIGSIAARAHEEEYRTDLMRRFTSSALSAQHAFNLRRQGELWLKLILAPLGRSLVFADQLQTDGKSFFEFLRDHNQSTERQIASLEAKARAVKALLESAPSQDKPS
jgi:hypothetical protein